MSFLSPIGNACVARRWLVMIVSGPSCWEMVGVYVVVVGQLSCLPDIGCGWATILLT